jgi:hypothetical protein
LGKPEVGSFSSLFKQPATTNKEFCTPDKGIANKAYYLGTTGPVREA